MLAQQDITYAAVIRRTLDALDGRVTIPEELWKAMPLSVLLGMVVAAATGGDKSGAATRARQQLEAFGSHPGLVALSRRLERIIDGDHDTRLSADLDPVRQGHRDHRADTHPCGRTIGPYAVPGTATCVNSSQRDRTRTPHQAGKRI